MLAREKQDDHDGWIQRGLGGILAREIQTAKTIVQTVQTVRTRIHGRDGFRMARSTYPTLIHRTVIGGLLWHLFDRNDEFEYAPNRLCVPLFSNQQRQNLYLRGTIAHINDFSGRREPLVVRNPEANPELKTNDASKAPKWLNLEEPAIVSVSRRTDVPACYGDWFMNCLQRGFAGYGNPFNKAKYLVSLKPEHVACFVFWSKDFEPFMDNLRAVRDEGYNCYIHFTITGLPRAFEPNVIETAKAIALFKEISAMFSPEQVHWRYDPIVLSEKTDDAYHLETCSRIAAELEGYTRQCVISFPTLYGKVERGIKRFQEEEGIRIYDTDEAHNIELANRLADIVGSHGMHMSSCCVEYLVGEKIQMARCVDGDLISRLFFDGEKTFEPKPTREGCGCAASFDIGAYDTCKNGCFYCYANANKEKAQRSFESHDPLSVFLGYSSEESEPWVEQGQKGH